MKTCLCCGTKCPYESAACSACGEASWSLTTTPPQALQLVASPEAKTEEEEKANLAEPPRAPLTPQTHQQRGGHRKRKRH